MRLPPLRAAGASLLLLGLAAAAAPAAPRVAAPFSPPAGAHVEGRPLLRWTLPPGEVVESVTVASAPDVRADGSFVQANVVEVGLLRGDELEWSPERALYAGDYWWNVGSTASSSLEPAYSAPAAFTIPPFVRIAGLRVLRSAGPYVRIELRYQTNVRRPLVGLRIVNGARTVWALSRQRLVLAPGEFELETVSWSRPRLLRAGMRLAVRASVAAGGAVAVRSASFRAP